MSDCDESTIMKVLVNQIKKRQGYRAGLCIPWKIQGYSEIHTEDTLVEMEWKDVHIETSIMRRLALTPERPSSYEGKDYICKYVRYTRLNKSKWEREEIKRERKRYVGERFLSDYFPYYYNVYISTLEYNSIFTSFTDVGHMDFV